jgi:hypothetical protein
MRTRRNEPCHCGSGNKFKRCCGVPPQVPRSMESPSAGITPAFYQPLGARIFARCGESDETSFAPINADYTPVGYRSGSRSASTRKRERIVLVYLRALSDGLVRDQDFCGMNGQVWDEPPK